MSNIMEPPRFVLNEAFVRHAYLNLSDKACEALERADRCAQHDDYDELICLCEKWGVDHEREGFTMKSLLSAIEEEFVRVGRLISPEVQQDVQNEIKRWRWRRGVKSSDYDEVDASEGYTA